MPSGARGLVDIFGVKPDHVGFVKDDYTTAAAAVTDALHRLGADTGDIIIEETDWSYDENGVPTLKIAQTEYSEEFLAFVKLVAPKSSVSGGTTVGERSSEHGRKIGGANSASGAKNAMMFHYGNPLADGKIPVTCNLVFFKKTTGSRKTKSGEFISPGVEATGVAAAAEIAIPAGLFDADLVTPAAQTFPKDFYEETFFLSPKA